MNNNTLQIKFKQRLNKLASEDFDNIQCWEIIESFNKAQLEWCRRQLRGSNLFKDGDEASKRRVDDLQILLKTVGLEGEDIEYNSEFGYFKSSNFSDIYEEDYLEYKKIETYATQVLPCYGGTPDRIIPGYIIPGEDPVYGERPYTPPVGEVLATYNEGEDPLYGHNKDIYCVGFLKERTEDVMTVYNSGTYTDEQMAERFPITECCYTITYFCTQGAGAGGTTMPWDDDGFCQCVAEETQGQGLDCEDFASANNLAWMNWDTGENYPTGPTMIPDSGEVCQEGTDPFWVCGEETENPGTYDEQVVCTEGVEEQWGERPLLSEGTDPVVVPEQTIPGTPETPAEPHPNAKNCCEDHRSMTCYLSEVANIDVVLRDPLKNPDYEWSETLVTMQDNEIRIWRKDFYILDPKLIYYRKPRNIQVKGCVDPYTNEESTLEIECEFKDDIVELIIDEAVSIVAGDIMDVNQFARGSQQAEKNN